MPNPGQKLKTNQSNDLKQKEIVI